MRTILGQEIAISLVALLVVILVVALVIKRLQAGDRKSKSNTGDRLTISESLKGISELFGNPYRLEKERRKYSKKSEVLRAFIEIDVELESSPYRARVSASGTIKHIFELASAEHKSINEFKKLPDAEKMKSFHNICLVQRDIILSENLCDVPLGSALGATLASMYIGAIASNEDAVIIRYMEKVLEKFDYQ